MMTVYGSRKICTHTGQEVRVGRFKILAAAEKDLWSEDLDKATLLVRLVGYVPWKFGGKYKIFAAPLKDYGGVPPEWSQFIDDLIWELEHGAKVLAFCQG